MPSRRAPRRSTAAACTRWLSPAWCTLPIDAAGPGVWPAARFDATRWLVQARMRSSLHSAASRWRTIGSPARPCSRASFRRRSTPEPPTAPAATRTGAGHHLPLARERRAGDAPAVVDVAEAPEVGDPGLVEEHLVELDLTADVPQRSHVDTGLVHVDEEVRDALVLRPARVGAGQEDGEVGVLTPRGPHLLPGHDPLVAVAHRPRRERREIRARTGLAEELAPLLLVADDGRQEPQLLLVGAVREQCGRGVVQPQRVQRGASCTASAPPASRSRSRESPRGPRTRVAHVGITRPDAPNTGYQAS